MNIKKSLKDVVVLVAICVVFATVLAAVNSVTAPIIAEQLAGAANQAYEAVMPGAAGFEDVDLSQYQLPATVKEAKRETSGKGFAIKLETKGYDNGMVIIVGVSSDGVVTGATCIASKETNGEEKSYGDNFTGKDKDSASSVDLVSGSTLTTQAYRSAVVDAINASIILGGGSVDVRTEEQILADNLAAALPAGNGAFTKMFMVEVVEGVDNIYVADNGAGYVVVIDGNFIGVDSNGAAVKVIDSETVEVTEGIDELKTSAEAAVAVVSATELTDVTLSGEHKISFNSIGQQAFAIVTKVQKTASNNYVIDIDTDGYGVMGDDSGYLKGSGEDIKIRVSISADGKVIDTQTVYHSETDSIGGLQLKDGAYNAGFIGKTETETNGVDIVAGCTRTTIAYKYAVLLAFETVANITEGGAN